MYNLIVTASEGAWNGRTYELEANRFGEHTASAIAKRYTALDPAAVSELMSFPTIFAYEQFRNIDARLGFLRQIRQRSNTSRIEIDYSFYPGLPPIPSTELSRLRQQLDIDEWELGRTHWAIKDIDLSSILVNANLITKEQQAQIYSHMYISGRVGLPGQLIVAPQVFKIPEQQVETDLVSVMMPFDSAFTHVYDAIKGTCSDVGLRCLRADDIWLDSTVIQDVFNLIFRSCIVIVDFSRKNPNVMYETGIAHTLGRTVIPLSQSLDDIPFDLRHHRVLQYYPNAEGLGVMKSKLSERLQNLTSKPKL